MIRTVLVLIALALLAPPASAGFRDVGRFLYGTTLKATGAALSFTLHEACHFATTAAFGGKARFREGSVYAWGTSKRGHRASAIAGGVCTGILAELIIAKRWHKKSHVAWGALAFHTGNVIGYGTVNYGDAGNWVDLGGKRSTWRAVHYFHGSRTAYVLARDFDWNLMLN